MIRNIIFDLGNVLIRFEPGEYLKKRGLSPDERDFLLREIFGSAEWVELDRGSMKAGEALDRIKSRNPGRGELIDRFSDFSPILEPLEDNTSLLPLLKREGYRLYYLTNYHDELFDGTVGCKPFFSSFDGGIVSSRVGLIKPERKIYELLLESCGLVPEETLFIDDSEKNTVAAAALGMETIHLEEPRLLEKLLREKLT